MRKFRKAGISILSFVLCLALVLSFVPTAFAMGAEPTSSVSAEPTSSVSAEPTSSASAEPTSSASAEPTSSASAEPTSSASAEPTSSASAEPTSSASADENALLAAPGAGYFYDAETKTLSVLSNAGTTAWKSDTLIDPLAVETVLIGGAVTTIGGSAFYGCNNLTHVSIPEGVTAIGNYAFTGTKITHIDLPTTLRTMGTAAFAYSALRSVVVPEGVQRLESSLFKDCTALTSASLPQSIEYIGAGAFENCPMLQSIVIPKNVTKIMNDAFSGDVSLGTIYARPTTPPELRSRAFRNLPSTYKVYVPDGTTAAYEAAWTDAVGHIVTSAGYDYDEASKTLTILTDAGMTAWQSNPAIERQQIQRVVIASGVTSIVNGAFDGCIGLGFVEIPGSVASIGTNAFDGCSNLETVAIPDGVQSIGENAFSSSGLTAVTIPGSVINIGASAFEGCSELESIHMMDGVQSIGGNAFALCPISSIVIPGSVTSIGDGVFARCSLLNGVSMAGTTPPTIGTGVFYGAHELYAIFVPAGTVAAYKAASGWDEYQKYVTDAEYFYDDTTKTLMILTDRGTTEWREDPAIDKSAVQNVLLYSSVSAIGDGAFEGCDSLASIDIPNSVTSIGASAFSGSGLASVSVPGSVMSIGVSAFEACSNLSSIQLADGLQSIGNNAFALCPISSIAIPGSVVSIGDAVFSRCSLLNSVVMQGTIPPTIGTGVFYGVHELYAILVPAGTVAAYQTASGWAEYQQYLTDAQYVFDAEEKLLLILSDVGISEWRDDTSFGPDDVEVVMLADGVTRIDRNAFSKCVNLKYVAIPDTTTVIAQGAFSSCVSLEAIIIPESVQNIENNAFAGCASLATVVVNREIPAAFGEDVFVNLPEDFRIYVSDETVDTYRAADGWNAYADHIVGMSAGYSYDPTERVLTIFTNSGVMAWRDDASFGPDDVEIVFLKDGVTEVQDYAFQKCVNLQYVGFPMTTTSIGQGAFSSCVSLGAVLIPSSVRIIGDYAFAGCSSMQVVWVESKMPAALGMDAFLNLPADFAIYVPKGTVAIYKAADGWKNYADHIMEASAMYVIYAEAGEHGTLNATGSVPVEEDQSFTFRFTPDKGYRVGKVTVDGKVVATDGKTYTFEQVRANHTIQVEFVEGGGSPQTGDEANMAGYIGLMIAAGCAIAGTALLFRKRSGAKDVRRGS